MNTRHVHRGPAGAGFGTEVCKGTGGKWGGFFASRKDAKAQRAAWGAAWGFLLGNRGFSLLPWGVFSVEAVKMGIFSSKKLSPTRKKVTPTTKGLTPTTKGMIHLRKSGSPLRERLSPTREAMGVQW